MSKQKERKLKKLKKQRVWPYILGILMVIFVFSLLAVILTSFTAISIAYDKMQAGYDNSVKIAEVIDEKWNEDNSADITQLCDDILTVVPNISDICIVNEDKEVVYQYQQGEEVPDWGNEINSLSRDGARFLLSNDEANFVMLSNGVIEFQITDAQAEEAQDVEVVVVEEVELDENVLWNGKTLTKVGFWYAFPMADGSYSVCVKNSVPIREAELFFVAFVLDVIVILALVLIIYYLVSIASLVFERRKLSRILETDVVTGGYNMQHFTKRGTKLLKKWRKSAHNYAVVIIRMEKYRNFCSCYGVKEAEELMEGFYNVLRQAVSKKEIVAHAEKADFTLLLTYKTEEELNYRLRELLLKMNAVKVEHKKYFSVGVYSVQNAKLGIDSMYNCAEIARGKVTEESTNRIVWFNEEMQKELLWMVKVENDMERALRNREFQVYLQPKYSTRDEKLSGAEALVRWIHPTEGFVAPYRFIPIFENNGFVIHLDDYMITEVARQQAKWIAEGKKVVPISVNVSRVHFAREDLAEHICKLVDQFNVPHDVIELELTESAFFDDKDMLLNTIKKLKAYGFEISMDDFGAGYSSLNSLKELPLDVVKLDAGFFREEDKEGRGKLIVGDTISLAKKLDMRIVAEGIETREQVDFLATMDCDLIQGYYFAKPMPISEFEEKAFGLHNKE